MPYLDEPEEEPEDGPGFGTPLPPEDRLWRHPSEMAAERALAAEPAAPGPSSHGRLWTVGLASATFGVIATLAILTVIGTFDRPVQKTAIEQVEVAAPAATEHRAVDAVAPAVVRIDVHRSGATTDIGGVVFRSDGHILTTADGVTGADTLTVVTSTGAVLPATLVGTDPSSDVAVLHVDAANLPTAVLGHVDQVVAGDPALGVAPTEDPASGPAVVTGTVTSTGTRVDLPDGHALHDMITATLDGGVLPGTVLCTSDGSVVGVLTSRPSPSADTPALGQAATTTVSTVVASTAAPHYATPIDYAARIADELISTGTARHTWMGVQGQDLDAATAAKIGRAGALITQVVTGGPADKAGVRPGDIVLGVDGNQITSISSLVVALRDRQDGDVVPVTILRDGTQRVVPVTLTSHS